MTAKTVSEWKEIRYWSLDSTSSTQGIDKWVLVLKKEWSLHGLVKTALRQTSIENTELGLYMLVMVWKEIDIYRTVEVN